MPETRSSPKARMGAHSKDERALNSQSRAAHAAERQALSGVELVDVMERILLKLDEILQKMQGPPSA